MRTIIKEHGKRKYVITGMCTSCYKLKHFTYQKEGVPKDIPWEIKKRCSCGNIGFAVLDDHIAETIQLLNRKGYATKYCCEGHEPSRFHSYAEPGYVFFRDDMHEVWAEHPLPESWHIEFELRGRHQKFKNRTIRETIPKEGRYSTKKRMDDLYKWATSLD